MAGMAGARLCAGTNARMHTAQLRAVCMVWGSGWEQLLLHAQHSAPRCAALARRRASLLLVAPARCTTPRACTTTARQFSNHTGYPLIRGHVFDGAHLQQLLEGLTANGLLGHSHLLTGARAAAVLPCAVWAAHAVRMLRTLRASPVLASQHDSLLSQPRAEAPRAATQATSGACPCWRAWQQWRRRCVPPTRASHTARARAPRRAVLIHADARMAATAATAAASNRCSRQPPA